MVVEARWPRPAALLAAGLLANVLVAAALALRGGGVGGIVAALPIIVLAFAALVSSERPVLLGAALGLGLTISYLNVPLPIPGGKPIYASDVVAAAALAAAALRSTLNRRSRDAAKAKAPRPAVLGWPFVLFSGIVFLDLLRGHARYGQSLLGQPARFIYFAGIAGAILHLNAKQVHRALTVVFYGGAGWMLLNAMYYIATGKHQTDQTNLSTGGTRWLSLSVAMLVAGSLFLAILNLSIHKSARLRSLDFAVAGVALLEIALAQGRATFLAVVLVLPFLFLLFRGAGRAVLVMLPLTLPILIVAGFIVVRAAPNLVPTLVERISNTSSSDLNVRWRIAASTAVLEQYHQSPLTGVGFGRMTTFQLDVSSIYGPGAVQENVTQPGRARRLRLSSSPPEASPSSRRSCSSSRPTRGTRGCDCAARSTRTSASSSSGESRRWSTS